MATVAQRSRFRGAVADPGGATPVFSDAEIDDLFAEAAEVYPEANSELSLAYAVRAGIEIVIANTAKQVTYTQNEHTDSLSDVSKRFLDLHAVWAAKLKEAEDRAERAAGKSNIRFGPMKNYPTRTKDFPDA